MTGTPFISLDSPILSSSKSLHFHNGSMTNVLCIYTYIPDIGEPAEQLNSIHSGIAGSIGYPLGRIIRRIDSCLWGILTYLHANTPVAYEVTSASGHSAEPHVNSKQHAQLPQTPYNIRP